MVVEVELVERDVLDVELVLEDVELVEELVLEVEVVLWENIS